ncbi:MAG: MipA/OmpV family protein [Pseudomonadota bacterium]
MMRRLLLASALAAPGAHAALPLWEAGVAAGTASTPAYPGAEARASRTLALPFLIYRGEVLRSDQGGVGARLLHTEQADVDVGFSLSLPSHSRDDAARAGMPDLGTLFEFGPRVKFKLADPRWQIELPLRSVIEVRGGLHRVGWTFEPKLALRLRGEEDHSQVEAHLGVMAGDQGVNRYFYEVAPQYATAARPAYQARAGLLLVRAGLSAAWRVHPSVRTFSFLRYDAYAHAANADSPLMQRRSGLSLGVGAAWTLAQSGVPARQSD